MQRSESGETRRLLARARSGDSAAFTQLFTRHRELLRLVLRSQMSPALRQKADSDDLLQETYLTASQSLPEFRGQNIEAFLRWLQVIAARRVCDAYRRYLGAQKRAARREVSLERMLDVARRSTDRLAAQLAAPGASPSQAHRHNEMLVELANAISELPEHYQKVIELRFIREYSLDQISAEIGRSKGAVMMLLARAVERLRGTMKDGGW
ncbi:MAG: sigma-70 family RNA polymerase sigma factor [Planctomycetes bacterium]|nr:sigma-70 family RNA polymerase sigma factor [Planctomycetota bacterium]